ncbi:ATP synthase subunit delta [Bacteroidia bacterium]|nr:ATP synthase subunit delta [Bacteroidia bacterium]
MDSGMLSARYAKALVAYATLGDRVEEVYRDATALEEALGRYDELGRLLSNPMITDQRKVDAVRLCCGEAATEEFLRFVALVIRQRRQTRLRLICLSYMIMVERGRNIMRADVVTALATDASTARALEKRLEEFTGKRVTVRAHVEPAIMGGFVLSWEGYRFDASVRTRLKKIEKQLTNINNYDR